MTRSEAQKAADKRYRETHKKDSVTWGTKLTPAEAAEIDAIIKNSGMNRAQFLSWAAGELKQKNK